MRIEFGEPTTGLKVSPRDFRPGVLYHLPGIEAVYVQTMCHIVKITPSDGVFVIDLKYFCDNNSHLLFEVVDFPVTFSNSTA